MSAETLFQIISILPYPGWLLLILAPSSRWTERIVASCVLTNLLGVIYLALLVGYFRSPLSVFLSLQGIQEQMQNPPLANAAWAHFLGFDLLVGSWECQEARRLGIPHPLVIPCLILTYMFGPIGLLLFFLLRWAMRREAQLGLAWAAK